MEILSIDSEGKFATISLTTQMGVNHTVKVVAARDHYFFSDHQTTPLHPHISGSRICLDSNIKEGIYNLLRAGAFEEAVIMLGVALEVVNMSSAYGDRYQDFGQCYICNEWLKRKDIHRCSLCGTFFCPSCSAQCSCGGSTLSVCKNCSKLSNDKCVYCVVETLLPDGATSIYRLDLDISLLRIIEKEVQTIEELDLALQNGTKFPGIGKVKLEQITNARQAYTERASDS